VNCATIAWSPAHMPDRYSLMWYDGKQWRPVFAGDAWREPAQLLESFFFEKVTTRMIRLVGVSRGGVGLRVAECKLFDVPQVTREPEDVAGEAARSYRPDDNGYIRDWLVCGPFATPGISKLEDPTRIAQGTWLSHDHLVDIRKGQVVPRSFAPSLEDAFVTVFPAMDGVQWKSGRVILRWLPVHSQRSYVDLVESMRVDLLFESRRELSQVAAYCACYVDMPRPFKGAVAIGSDDGFRLWIDGARVATKPVCRGAAADSDKYMIKLDKGQHLVLIKIINDTDDHGFFLRFLQQNGPLKDFTVRLAPGGYARRNAASAETMLD